MSANDYEIVSEECTCDAVHYIVTASPLIVYCLKISMST